MEAINVGGNLESCKASSETDYWSIVLVIFAILFLTHFTP